MLKWRAIFVFLVTGALTAMGIWLSGAAGSPVAKAELWAQDVIARKGRLVARDPKLIYLAIDTESVSLDATTDLEKFFGVSGSATTPEGQALREMSHEWPWPRSVYARVLDRLVGAGAKVVAFDLLYPTAGEGDALFREALARHREKVVIGSNFTNETTAANLHAATASISLPSDTLIPPAEMRDDRVGYVNFWPDLDRTIRSSKFQANFREFHPRGQSLGESNYVSLAAQILRKAGHPEKVPADTQPRNFRFTASPQEGFPPRSIFEIFVPEYWARNYQSGAIFKDAIVVIGAGGNWQHDEHPTPFGPMAGPEIQLNVISAALQGEFIFPVSPAWSWTIWVLAGCAAAAACLWLSRPERRFVILILIAGAWIGAQFLLFDHASLIAPTAGPATLLVLVGLIVLTVDVVIAGAEQFRLRVALVERKRAQTLLEEANAHLEERVAARTLELSSANDRLTGLLHEKNVLLKEVHHRVKNNLQIISSLLNLQSNAIEDPDVRRVFADSRNRVRSMALIHEKLYQSEDLSRIDFADYIRALTGGLQTSFGGAASSVRIAVDVEEIQLAVDAAVPCGLIVNELVTNCFKYAFRDGRAGEVHIGLKRTETSRLSLSVRDNGTGFPKDLDIRNTESLGMQIVTTLTDQLDGTLTLRNGVGTTFEIEFPDTTHLQP